MGKDIEYRLAGPTHPTGTLHETHMSLPDDCESCHVQGGGIDSEKCAACHIDPDTGDPDDERISRSVDVLAPEGYGEIIGGGQREDDLAVLEAAIATHELPRAAFEWFLDLRRYGSVPHGGFGLGLERTLAWICGADHLRECIPFPRMLYRIYP